MPYLVIYRLQRHHVVVTMIWDEIYHIYYHNYLIFKTHYSLSAKECTTLFQVNTKKKIGKTKTNKMYKSQKLASFYIWYIHIIFGIKSPIIFFSIVFIFTILILLHILDEFPEVENIIVCKTK